LFISPSEFRRKKNGPAKPAREMVLIILSHGHQNHHREAIMSYG
jgi:hypothetical protein